MEGQGQVSVPPRRHYLYCDGSCIKSRGGCGIVYAYQDTNSLTSYFISWGVKIPIFPCTNNIAELTAIKECLVFILTQGNKENLYTIRSDSEYAIKCIIEWSTNWEKNGWKTATNKEVKNKELIQEILQLYRSVSNQVVFEHVFAHTGDFYNEICDKLAKDKTALNPQ